MKSLPKGVRVSPSGDAESLNELSEGFATAITAGLMMVYAVLVLLFHDFLQPATILSALPLALAGVLDIEDFRRALVADPARYIAQPTLSLSSCPTFVDSGLAPRHIDLRPFVLSGRTVQMVPGGLTRVALKEGSLVVNSSQGGGTKDTWILQA